MVLKVLNLLEIVKTSELIIVLQCNMYFLSNLFYRYLSFDVHFQLDRYYNATKKYEGSYRSETARVMATS